MTKHETTETNIDAVIEDIRSVLKSNCEITKYFSGELRYLADRQKIWQTSGIRVGLVGVTSSGKSTLTNAFLGSKLLPTAVRPSSNSIVSCARGKTVKCTITFNGSKRKPLIVHGSKVAETVSYYGDEATNGCNREGVSEIHLESPNFRLGNGVSVIDTPGLDAYGLDQHEKLTLEVLLPTLDMVVFVTTCKANSDEKMRDYVCIAKDHGKPVAVVQNMVDSVVAKLGPRGEILKSKDDVIKEHYARADGVLKKAGLTAVAIYQVSAELAIRKQKATSGLSELVAGMQQEFDALAPEIEGGRRRQIDHWLRALIARELKPAGSAAVLKEQTAAVAKLRHQQNELKQRYASVAVRSDAVSEAAQAAAALIIGQASTLTSQGVDEASAVQHQIEAWLKESSTQLRALNKQLDAQIQSDCRKVNLTLKDIDLTESLLRPTSIVDLRMTRHSRTVRSEQSGGWGWVKRKVDYFDAKWGYDEHETYWSEISDVDAFKEDVNASASNELKYVQQFTCAVARRSKGVCRQLARWISCQIVDLEKKMKASCEIRDRRIVASGLKRLLIYPQGWKAMGRPHANGVMHKPLSLNRIEIAVSDATLAMVRLATCIARRRFLAIRDEVIFEQAIHGWTRVERVLILGFDRNCLAGFINRFWFDVLEFEPSPSLTFERLHLSDPRFHEIGVALDNGGGRDQQHKVYSTFVSGSSVMFLMIDIQQIGSTRSALSRTGIKFNKLSLPIVIVVQSIVELFVSDAVWEAMRELEGLIDSTGMRVAGVIVNDDKLVYSRVANALITSREALNTISEQIKFVGTLPENDREEAGRIIRRWAATAPPRQIGGGRA